MGGYNPTYHHGNILRAARGPESVVDWPAVRVRPGAEEVPRYHPAVPQDRRDHRALRGPALGKDHAPLPDHKAAAHRKKSPGKKYSLRQLR